MGFMLVYIIVNLKMEFKFKLILRALFEEVIYLKCVYNI